jgi:hypothetical protein
VHGSEVREDRCVQADNILLSTMGPELEDHAVAEIFGE